MFQNQRKVTIEWGDCDPAGIVFYPRYFAMFNASTDALFDAALGYGTFEMLKKFAIIGFPMVDTRAVFFAPSRFGDSVTIETKVVELKRSSFKIEHQLFSSSGARAIEAFETRVWAAVDPQNPDKIMGQPIPDEVAARLSGEA